MVVGDVTTAVDMIVLGGGPGGYVAAIRAAQLGRKVTLIDAGEPGGTCLNTGCIPLKALLSASERYTQARGTDLAAMGIASEHVTFDWKQMQTWKESVVHRLSGGVQRLLKSQGVECIHGTGWFINDQEIRVEGEYGSLRFKFDTCIIATGATAPPTRNLPSSDARVLTPEEALALPELPSSLSISGNNFLALELATLFARLDVRVKLFTPGPDLLPGLDTTALRLLQASLRKQGISVNANVAPTAIAEYPLIICGPYAPRVSQLHLDAAGIQLASDGGIQIDNQQHTSQPHIFAVGDCSSGSPRLASWAIKQGKVAAEVSAGRRVQFAPQFTPLVIHTTPEIALLLPSGGQPEEANTPTISGRFPLAANGRALTLGSDNGLALLTANADGTLRAATLVGPRAGDLINQLTLAFEMGATLTDLDEILYAHPGLGETILEAAEQAQKKAIHTGN